MNLMAWYAEAMWGGLLTGAYPGGAHRTMMMTMTTLPRPRATSDKSELRLLMLRNPSASSSKKCC